MHRFFPLILALALIISFSKQSNASNAEAREVARINNCSPKKIEVYFQKMGRESQTIYRIDCIPPKTSNENLPKMANAMLVQCDGSLCEMLRPIEAETK